MEDLRCAGNHRKLLLRQLDETKIRSAKLHLLPEAKSQSILKQRGCCCFFYARFRICRDCGSFCGSRGAVHFVVFKGRQFNPWFTSSGWHCAGLAGTRAYSFADVKNRLLSCLPGNTKRCFRVWSACDGNHFYWFRHLRRCFENNEQWLRTRFAATIPSNKSPWKE